MWTFPPRRMLCPVDFGEASAAAVRTAGLLAERFDAELVVLHAEAFDVPPYFTSEQLALFEQERAAARRQATAYVARFARAATRAPVSPVVAEGPPSATILREAPGYDLIVMGTHGRRGPSRWWLGSVAERVVRESPVPVLVVRAGATGAGPELFARVVTAGEAERETRSYADRLSDAFGGRVVQTPPVPPEDAVRQADATLVIAELPSGASSAAAVEHVAAFVRTCERPVLFLPRHSAAAA